MKRKESMSNSLKDSQDNGTGSQSDSPLDSPPTGKPKKSKDKHGKGSKKRSRSPYKCNKCGKLKKGHICTATPKVPNKLMEAKAPMPVSPVVSSDNPTQADYLMDGNTSTAANTYFNATPISDEFLSYSGNSFPSSYSLADYAAYNLGTGSSSTGLPGDPGSMDLSQLAYGEGEMPISGMGIGLDKSKVTFFSCWFDMAKNGIEMLETFLNTQKPSWDILQDVVTTLEADKRKIEEWKQRFNEEVIKKVAAQQIAEAHHQQQLQHSQHPQHPHSHGRLFSQSAAGSQDETTATASGSQSQTTQTDFLASQGRGEDDEADEDDEEEEEEEEEDDDSARSSDPKRRRLRYSDAPSVLVSSVTEAPTPRSTAVTRTANAAPHPTEGSRVGASTTSDMNLDGVASADGEEVGIPNFKDMNDSGELMEVESKHEG